MTLGLQANPLGPAGVVAILTSPHLSKVAALDLARTGCTPAALEVVPAVADRLTALNLAGNDLGDLGVQHLCRWPLAALRDLDLSRAGIGDDGAAALAATPHLAGLRRLALNGNRMTEAGKRRLAESPYLKRIHALELSENSLVAPVAGRS